MSGLATRMALSAFPLGTKSTCRALHAPLRAPRHPIGRYSVPTRLPNVVSAAAEEPKPKRGRKKKSTSSKPTEAGPTNAQGADLKKLHEELMQQIADRKRAQAELSSMLNVEEEANGAKAAPPPAKPARARTAKPTKPAMPAKPVAATPQPIAPAQSKPPLDASKVASPAPPQAAPAPPTAAPPSPPEPEKDLLNIVMVASECAPWSKTGGLGDVVGALPKFLAARGHRVMVVCPRYKCYEDAWETGVRHRVRVMGQDHEYGYFHSFIDGVDFVFVDHSSYLSFGDNIYGGSRQDIQFRCALLCKAALEAPKVVPCGDSVYGDESLVFIANDWHTALLPVYLNAHYRDHGQMGFARSVFVIHNIAHQGRAPMDELSGFEIPDNYTELFRLYDPIGGEHMNIMKAGLNQAHRIVAVSNGYAWECQTQEGGWGLDGVIRENNWKLRGVVNGIDINDWNPAVDVHLESDGYTKYSLDNFREGKAKCKEALQRELGLPVEPNVPMLGFIGRLDYQKGVDLIADIYPWLMSENVQLVLLGSGREDLEGMMRDMENQNGNCKAWVGFSVRTAHRITAAADILLMPSRFEPCGLNQLYAMEYGRSLRVLIFQSRLL